MKKKMKQRKKDGDKTTKKKKDSSKNDDDEDSITQNMPEEMRQRIKSKRKRNKEMLEKLTQQIKTFDNNKIICNDKSETNNKIGIKENKNEKSDQAEGNDKEKVKNNDKNNDGDKVKNIDNNNEEDNDKNNDKDSDEDNDKEYVVERILNHMRKRRTKMLLIKWKGYEKPTWEPEETMRLSINDDVEMYWKNLKPKKDAESKKVAVYCSLEHSNPLNFYQTSDAWEVERNICNGKDCSINFGVEKLTNKNVVWVCEGRKRCICNVVYCNECYYNNKNVLQGKRKRN